MKQLIVLIFSLLTSHTALSSPISCEEVEIKNFRQERYEKVVAKQLKSQIKNLDNVKVVETLKYQSWIILKVETTVSDDVFLFYSKDPLSSKYLKSWGGAIVPGEEKSVEEWLNSNIKGIPAKLAKCFVSHVGPN